MHHTEYLRGLTPHARLHAERLLGVHPDLRLTSGRRSPDGNRRVGGVPNSYHLRGRAIDLSGRRDILRAAAETARTQRVTALCSGPEEVILESDHLHVAW